MRKVLTICVVLAVMLPAYATETATQAVQHMGIGWNLGNTLDSNSGDTTNMWIEQWSKATPTDYETAWGQKAATRELIHMMKEAGFGVIRVPVTWYPHMGVKLSSKLLWNQSQWNPTPVDAAWMDRVQEVVDYVIDEGMYCILNVHHDTGTASTAWIRASMDNYNRNDSLFRDLWTQIATRFRDYDEHLVLEAYNEMTDEYGSWCFASMGAPGNYNAAAANDTYQAINSYANAFVEAVRATGGNNSDRNLMVNTYAACSGHGTWSNHLTEPLTKFVVPTDPCGTQDHLMISVHSYPSLQNNGSYISTKSMQQIITQQVNVLRTHLIHGKNVPVVMGEWGSSNESSDGKTDYEKSRTLYLQFVSEMTRQCLEAGICPVYWMGLSDGEHRAVPEFNQPDVLQAMMNATGLTEKEHEGVCPRVELVNERLVIRRGVNTFGIDGCLLKR